MALFAILHIWAYPWKAYDIKRSAGMTESGAGYDLDITAYQGGKLGIKAYADAFNPWDIIKAIGRGFKWAIVGRRHRETDASYKQHLSSTPLEDGTKMKGSYEPLDDNVDEGHYTYDSYHQNAINSQNPSNPPQNGEFDQRTVMPGRIREDDGFTQAPYSQRDAGRHEFSADTSYHSAASGAPYGQGVAMPDETHFTHAR
jgi:hypothetical protein